MRLVASPAVIDAILWSLAERQLNPRQFKAMFGPSKYITGVAYHFIEIEAERENIHISLEEHLMCLYWLKKL